MVKTNLASSIFHVAVNQCVERNVLVLAMEHAVKNIVVVQKAAKTGSEDAIVPRVNAEVDNVHALLLDVNVIQTSVEIVGLAVGMVHWGSHHGVDKVSVEI
jgi:predicted transcriptional regulator